MARNSVSSHWLAHLTDDEITSRIQALGPQTRRRMATRYFPGRAPAQPFTPLPDALAEADALFDVVKRPLIAVIPPALGGDEPSAVEVPGKVALCRSDSDRPLGVAGENYGIVQTIEGMAAAQVWAGEGALDIASVHVIDGGSRIRVAGLIGESVIDQPGRGPDLLGHCATFEVAHDGIHANSCALHTVRIVCFNGMTARSHVNSFRLRHTSKAADRNEDAQKLMLGVQRAAVAEAEVFADLAQRRMTLSDFRLFARDLLYQVKGAVDEDASERRRKRRARDLEQLESYFQGGEGNVGASGYDAYNAVTEWITPRLERMKSAAAFAKRFESAETGTASDVRARALRMLTR